MNLKAQIEQNQLAANKLTKVKILGIINVIGEVILLLFTLYFQFWLLSDKNTIENLGKNVTPIWIRILYKTLILYGFSLVLLIAKIAYVVVSFKMLKNYHFVEKQYKNTNSSAITLIIVGYALTNIIGLIGIFQLQKDINYSASELVKAQKTLAKEY